jgi:predicted dehydrogenase
MRSQTGARSMAKIRVGLIGCGFAAELHMHAYRRIAP